MRGVCELVVHGFLVALERSSTVAFTTARKASPLSSDPLPIDRLGLPCGQVQQAWPRFQPAPDASYFLDLPAMERRWNDEQ